MIAYGRRPEPVLSKQAGGSLGELLEEFSGGALLTFAFHQAAGMLAVQGSMSVQTPWCSFSLVRSSEAANSRTLAERVVSGTQEASLRSADEGMDREADRVA